MPYRDARTPLLLRRETLSRDLSDLDAELVRAALLADQRGVVAAELAEVDRRLHDLRARSLPLLGRVTIATPCTAAWEHMPGDDMVRACGECDLEVFDISAMTEDEAEAFLTERLGTKTCVRLHRRADGTIITRDCAVGGRRRRKRLGASALAIAMAGVALAAATSSPGAEATPLRTSKDGISAAPPVVFTSRTMGASAIREEEVEPSLLKDMRQHAGRIPRDAGSARTKGSPPPKR